MGLVSASGTDQHTPPAEAIGNPAAAAAWLERNVVESLPSGGLKRKLEQSAAESRPLRVKLGIDPTAPDIHLGFTVVLGKLREFQELGHQVVLIIGDWTARVGDPSGRSATRPQLSIEEINANAETFADQALKVLRSDRLEVRRNGEWLDMPLDELFGILRTTTVAQVTEREDIANRLRSGTPVSLLELLYPVLQAYDSVAVEADVELGGTDQHFNLLLGRDLQRAFGQQEQVAIELPILTGTDGERKMSKSLGNYIGITEAPADIYGKTMRVPDSALGEWYGLLVGNPPSEALTPRDAKRQLARELVTRFHSETAAAEAESHFDRVIVRGEMPEEIEEGHIASDSEATVHLPAVLSELFGISRSEARRSISAGGVKLDGAPVAELDLVARELDGKVLQLGPRRHRRIIVD